MSKYIDADEVIKVLTNNQTYSATVLKAIIDRIPKADVEHVRHGHWIYIGTDKTNNIFTCSECGRHIKNQCYETTAIVRIRFPYCNCGAKMDGKEGEN